MIEVFFNSVLSVYIHTETSYYLEVFQSASTLNTPQSTMTQGDFGLSLKVSCASRMSRTRAPSITCLQNKKVSK